MKRRDPADVLEDLEFLDSTNVGAKDAAKRAGFASAEALEVWLRRNERSDLWQRMKRRDPVGIHEERRKPEAQRIDPLAALLSVAAESSRARTRKKGERLAELVADLRATLAAEKQDDERKEAARKEIERLERELARAKADLRGTTSTAVDGDVTSAELRAWAKRHSIPCPDRGRIPAAVREAYEAKEVAS